MSRVVLNLAIDLAVVYSVIEPSIEINSPTAHLPRESRPCVPSILKPPELHRVACCRAVAMNMSNMVVFLTIPLISRVHGRTAGHAWGGSPGRRRPICDGMVWAELASAVLSLWAGPSSTPRLLTAAHGWAGCSPSCSSGSLLLWAAGSRVGQHWSCPVLAFAYLDRLLRMGRGDARAPPRECST